MTDRFDHYGEQGKFKPFSEAREQRKLKKYKKSKFIRLRASGLTIEAASKKTGISMRTGARLNVDPVIKSKMARALDQVGATEIKIAKTVHEAMEATKVISATIVMKGSGDLISKSNGDLAEATSMTKDFIEVPDHMARIKACELAGKFRGDFMEKQAVVHSGEVSHTVEVVDYSKLIVQK